MAGGGREALDLARVNPPDVIILDLIMPDLDGFAVLEQLKEEPRTSEIPVIIVTAKDLSLEEKSLLGSSTRKIITKGKTEKKKLLKEIEAALDQVEKQRVLEREKKKPHILIVEDNEVAVLQIRTALVEAGMDITVASGGMEAIESVKRTVPDAIILDLMMPEIDGFQVLESIRSTEWTADIPVLVLTAKELTSEDRARLSVNNVQELVQKGSVDRDKLIEKIEKLLKKESKTSKSEPVEPPESYKETSKKSKTILVVEDNHDNLLTITAILEENGFKYITAEDGEQAVTKAKESHPGLILMDIHLPKLSGTDAAKQIKADPEFADIPVIALTAKAMKGDRETILSSGCDDYIPKPINPDNLIRIIQKWMG